MIDATSATGFLPTLPITAAVLARHPEPIAALANEGVEFAVHGLHHNDHLARSPEGQRHDIERAVEIFRENGVDPRGFRAPYLRASPSTEAAVRAAGLIYESDEAIAFPASYFGGTDTETDGYRRALTMYQARDADRTRSRPSVADGLVRIPVSIPDDEMLVDRLHLNADSCSEVWNEMLRATHRRGELFTMQIHPERFEASAEAVSSVLASAAALPSGVWRARLEDIASWWLARRSCRLVAERVDAGRIRIHLVGDGRAQLAVTWAGTDPSRHDGSGRELILPTSTLPAVGVPPSAPAVLTSFLQEEGYLVTSTDRPDRCSVLLDPARDPSIDLEDEQELCARIDAASAPVARIQPWPAGYRSAFALTGDIDSLTIQDFVLRIWENSRLESMDLSEAHR